MSPNMDATQSNHRTRLLSLPPPVHLISMTTHGHSASSTHAHTRPDVTGHPSYAASTKKNPKQAHGTHRNETGDTYGTHTNMGSGNWGSPLPEVLGPWTPWWRPAWRAQHMGRGSRCVASPPASEPHKGNGHGGKGTGGRTGRHIKDLAHASQWMHNTG